MLLPRLLSRRGISLSRRFTTGLVESPPGPLFRPEGAVVAGQTGLKMPDPPSYMVTSSLPSITNLMADE